MEKLSDAELAEKTVEFRNRVKERLAKVPDAPADDEERGPCRELTVNRPDKKAIGTGLGVAAVIVAGAVFGAVLEDAAAAALCC